MKLFLTTRRRAKAFVVLCALLTAGISATAQPILRLPAIIGDHMVMQRDATVKIWGWADPRADVTVTPGWDHQPVKVKVGGDTKWIVELKTPSGAGPYSFTVNTSKAELKVEDILMGEVWLCSGQSNMNWSAQNGVKDMKEELTKELNPQIRLFTVTKQSSLYPQEDCHGTWQVCTPESARWFSAVGYFFGKRLASELGSPVGLINSSWGGSPAETWTPAEKFTDRQHLVQQWKKVPKSEGWDINIGTTYNAMIYPLLNTTLAGAIWYQGESNVPNGETYAELSTLMIEGWRESFAQTLPFYFVQLAPYARNKSINGVAIVREQQELVARTVPNTGIVTISDLVDDVMDIHPRYKKNVGNRLANYALAEVYGKQVPKHKNVSYKSISTDGQKAVINFNDTGKGLTLKGDRIETLEIAGADMKFVVAEGKIGRDGASIEVWSKEVKSPKAVRYSFSNGAVGNLFDSEGLPVMPFRTDADNSSAPAVKPAEKTSAGAVTVKGGEFEKRIFVKGTNIFINRSYPLSQVPQQFSGFEFLSWRVKGNYAESTSGVSITPQSDGKIYIAARKNKLTDSDLKGWTMIPDSEIRYKAAKSEGILYVFYMEAKAGKSVKLPVTTDFVGVLPLAKKIEY